MPPLTLGANMWSQASLGPSSNPSPIANPRSLGLPRIPQPLQRRIGSAHIKLEEMSALRRCPPALLAVHLAVARRPAREARQLRHVLLRPARVRRGARRLGGAAAALLFAGPPSSMARLSRSKEKLAGECCWSTPLPQPFPEPVRLLCGQEPDDLPDDLPEVLPEEAANRLDTKAAGEGQGGRGAGVRPGCGAGVWRNVRTS